MSSGQLDETEVFQDTIVAIATAQGPAGVGIVRLSGGSAVDIAKKLVKKPLEYELKPNYARLVDFIDPEGELIDQGIVLYFKSPFSFTGEDVIECQVHGAPVVLTHLVQVAIAYGARLADPGEFSKRAFLNGKMDLTQAEAVADLVSSQSNAQARAALRTLKGAFSSKVQLLSDALVALRAEVEARIDFVDEALDFMSVNQVSQKIEQIIFQVKRLLTTASKGVNLTQGVQVALVGEPNAGKSSLLNRLLGYDRAIVSEYAGTTRDTLSETALISGIPFRFVDTAGLRKTDSKIEKLGIERTHEALKESDCIVSVHDLTVGLNASESMSQNELKNDERVIWVLNKSDLVGEEAVKQKVEQQQLCSNSDLFNKKYAVVSALSGSGLEDLERVLVNQVNGQEMAACDFSARTRHVEALNRCVLYLEQSTVQLDESSWDLLAEDLRFGHQALQEITGTFSSDELLGKIFSSFCIGK